ncbi:hypothetical protein GCM10011609_26610 [Lentzea pudingi]|uniref:Uncharacterized protein n=1 Tax=Lentzea pudingi TaxID=1789439 RepID=A0ABQ2HSG6_9PSEU|nr:hypothetical protein GCM10011609_26610 [Lentzea pudingi]
MPGGNTRGGLIGHALVLTSAALYDDVLFRPGLEAGTDADAPGAAITITAMSARADVNRCLKRADTGTPLWLK